jgi:3-oxoadipate enol-lactonase
VTTALRARNGDVSLAYEVLGSGPPLLLIQGLGYGGRGWGPALDHLAEDFQVVAFDNRGFGASDIPPGPYTTALLAADAAAVLDAADLVRATVVGSSLGGMAAQELALSHADRVGRLVLVSTTPGGAEAHPMPSGTLALMAEAPTLPPEVALRRFVENALGPDAQGLADRVIEYRTANPPDLGGWQAQAAAGAAHNALERLGDLRTPTLVVHGTEDAVVDYRNGELLAERIPDARLELLDGCGHLVSWEEPKRLARLVREFAA